MEQDTHPKRDSVIRRRRVRPPRNDRPPRDFYIFQVYFQARPGARRQHFEAVRPKITERLHDMIRRGQLILGGDYPSSTGGTWLLKVRSRSEAERLVMDHPAVGCSLLTYRLIELQDPMGAVLHQERETPPEPAQ